MDKLLAGKTLLITGVATPESIAFATAARATALGARVVLTAFPRDLEQARACVATLPGAPPVISLDATDPEQIAFVTEELRSQVGHLDGVLHAIAFAPREALASFIGVKSSGVELAFRTSVHSYVALAGMLAELAPERGGSVVGLDFDAARAWPTYNWMGVCKAGLESANQYLARDLGPRRIRANLVAAGPLATRAASAIPGFDALVATWDSAPLAWDATNPGPVADAVCFLFSDMASAITGEILHVDGGRHAVNP
jgi:meromycolic acid enoyl-[acyl-carrier-protein] reductase